MPPPLVNNFGATLTRVTIEGRSTKFDWLVSGYDEPWEDYCFFAKIQLGNDPVMTTL